MAAVPSEPPKSPFRRLRRPSFYYNSHCCSSCDSAECGCGCCGDVTSSPETLGHVPNCARGLCPNPVGNRPGSPLTTLSSSTCGQSPVAVLGIAVAVSPRVGNCQLQASCLPSSGKSEAGQLSALLGHGSRQAVNRHLGTPTPVPIFRSPGRGNCKRLPATESPVTIGRWVLASWPGTPSVTHMCQPRASQH